MNRQDKLLSAMAHGLWELMNAVEEPSDKLRVARSNLDEAQREFNCFPWKSLGWRRTANLPTIVGKFEREGWQLKFCEDGYRAWLRDDEGDFRVEHWNAAESVWERDDET